MKALAEFNAMHLLAKNYERINCITVRSDSDGEVIIVSNVPSPLIDFFRAKIDELILREGSLAYNELEKAAERFIEATTKDANPATDNQK